MSTTYYLLRAKESAVGKGPYLGSDPEGKPALVTESLDARHFETLQSAEQQALEHGARLGEFEVEIRNTGT